MRYTLRVCLLLLCLAGCGLVHAQTWTQVIDDTFVRADTSTGGAGTNTGAGNGWIDENGGIANIHSDQLVMQCDAIDGNQYNRDHLLRPTSENEIDERMLIKFPTGQSSTNQSVLGIGVALRQQSAGNYYLLLWNPNAGSTSNVYIFKVVSNSPTALIGPVNCSANYNSAHAYSIDASVAGSTLKLIVTDTTAASQIASQTTTDSTFTTAGQSGFTVQNSAGSTVQTQYVLGEVITYNDLGALSVSAPIGTASENSAVPSVAWSAGTPFYTVKWYRGTSPTFVAGSGNLVATHSSASSPDTYTDSAAVAGTRYWYIAEVIDSGGGDVTTTAVMLVRKNPSLRICCIGDSNMYGFGTTTPGGASAPPAQIAGLIVAIDANRDVAVTNQGVNGSASGNWISGSADLIAAKTAMNALTGTVSVFIIALGTNDAKTENLISGSTYKSNLESMITDLRTNYPGCYISLNSMIYASPNWTDQSSASQNLDLNSYIPALQAIPADYDAKVFVGDLTAWDLTANNTATWYGDAPNFLHVNNTGATAWAGMMTQGMLRGLGIISGGGGPVHVIGG
ncbi:MAG: SGNH/GDSL hydrolase family protein [Fimbriimonadaceae bacterium]